jgi:ribosomal 30S subunit maturation factor RimM
LNKKELINYLPIAFIQDYFETRNYIKLTTKGDVIYSLDFPVDVWLVQIKSFRANFKIKREKEISHQKHYFLSYTGFTPEIIENLKFNIIPITLKELITRKKSLIVFFETMEPLREDIIGSWICINKDKIKKDRDIYFFDIKEKIVVDEKQNPIGKVSDYLETGAHGILVVELKETQKIIYIPFVDEYCRIHYTGKSIREIDFIELKDWQYFLDT